MPQDAPREVFAQLLPTRGKTRAASGNGLVTSVLAPIAGLHGGNGAKQIDVIARYCCVEEMDNAWTLAFHPPFINLLDFGHVDQHSVHFRIVFPAMFGVLNIIYWSYYLTRANMASQGTDRG